MPDHISPEARSVNMASIPSSGTIPEVILRKSLFRLGYRYRITPKGMPGRPDIVLPRYKAVVFVHGCFWHGHWCSKYRLPKTNSQYWEEKVEKNQERDRKTSTLLLNEGWRVAVVWECALRGPKKEHRLSVATAKLDTWLSSEELELEIPNETVVPK